MCGVYTMNGTEGLTWLDAGVGARSARCGSSTPRISRPTVRLRCRGRSYRAILHVEDLLAAERGGSPTRSASCAKCKWNVSGVLAFHVDSKSG
jgi:hypothetical protein